MYSYYSIFSTDFVQLLHCYEYITVYNVSTVYCTYVRMYKYSVRILVLLCFLKNMASMISNCTMALKHLVRSIQLSDMPRGSLPSSSADTSALGAFVGGGSWAFALQDVLRFLSLWFELGHYPDVAACVKRYVDEIRIEHWLLVIPQIIARLDTSHKTVQDGLVELLKRIGA